MIEVVRVESQGQVVQIGPGMPTHFIAEVGLNHNGSYEFARDLIYSSVVAGATFVKLQKRSPADLATGDFLDAPFAKAPFFGSTQREVREFLELTAEEYRELSTYARSLGAVLFASAFDIRSLEFLLDQGVGLIKVASHSSTNRPLLQEINRARLPVILSLGGTTLAEKDSAVEALQDCQRVLMHCVSEYPTPDDRMGLDTIGFLESRYGLPVGFSSHEVGTDFSVAATVLGAVMVERHVSLSRSMPGPDHSISLLPSELGELVARVRRVERGRGVTESLSIAEESTRSQYHVGVCSSRAIVKGEALTLDMISFKQPLGSSGKFYSSWEVAEALGKKALRSIPPDTPIAREWLGA